MSLIAHYKLDGNALDSSGNGNHGATVGTPNVVAGKIGSSYSFDYSSDDGISIPNNNFPLYDFTMTAWIKPVGNHYHYDGTIISSGNWNSSHWSFGVNQGNTGFSCRNPHISYASAPYTFSLNTWHFVVYRREGTNLKLYANNTLVYNSTVTTHIPLSSDATNTCIGRETYAGGYFGFNGSIDDVRIYDHALSEKEIKELAKAKILHYTFDEFQEPTENKYNLDVSYNTWPSSSSNMTTLGTKTGKHSFKVEGVCNVPGAYLYVYPYFNTNAVLTTLSAKVKNNNTKELRVDVTMREYGNKSDIVNNTKSFYIQPHRIEYIYLTSEGITTNSGYTPAFGVYSDSTDGTVNAEVYDIQLEEKDHATPFVNGTRIGSVSDNSGYDNHADLALATTPQWVEDSRIGKGAYKFNGSITNLISIPTSTITNFQDFTVSMWVNSSNLSKGINTIIHATNTGGNDFSIEMYSNRFIPLLTGSSNTFYTTNVINTWYHIVLKRTGTVVEMYKDGVSLGTNTFNSTLLNITGAIILGQEQDAVGGGFDANQAFEGLIDDVRIYATALSADDIKELYQTRASIDNRGNLFLHNINQPAVVADGLVGWWPLAGDTKDHSGFNNDGVNNGAVSTTGVAGEADTAYSFDGVDDHLLVNKLTGMRSYSIWVKAAATMAATCVVFTNIQTSTGLGFLNGTHLILVSGGAEVTQRTASLPIDFSLNSWYHICVNYSENNTPTCYINGVETSYGGSNYWIEYTSPYLQLGRRTTGNHFNGALADFKVYNRALSEGEIQLLYKEGLNLL